MAVTLAGFVVLCGAMILLCGRSQSRSAALRWREAHAPMMLAVIAGGCAAGAGPLMRGLVSRAPVEAAPDLTFVWLGIGPAAVGAALAAGFHLLGRAKVRAPEVWAMAIAGVAVCAMALADRLRLIDGQLLMLGGLTLLWWRTAAHPGAPGGGFDWRVPAGYLLAMVAGVAGFVGLVRAEVAWAPAACAGAMTVCFGAALWRNRGDEADEGGAGSGGWAALMAASLATGAVSVAHIGASAALEARRAVAFSGEPVAWVVADVARSGPYLGGLLSVAPEGLLLVVTAAALAVAARAEGARWIGGVAVICAGAGVLAWRAWGWWGLWVAG